MRLNRVHRLIPTSGRTSGRISGLCCLLTAGLVCSVATGTASGGSGPVLQEWAGNPLSNLSVAELARFEDGDFEFERTFNTADGLGPIFNQNSCVSCHSQPVGGSGSIFVTRFGGVDDDGNFIDFPGGSLLQANSIDPDVCLEVIPEEAFIIARRITTSTLGAGLVEAIPDAAIIANEDNPPAPWINGRIHWVENLDEGGPLIIGRFGWKGQLGNNIDFSADAAFEEMGITNRVFPVTNAPNGDMAAAELCDPFFGQVIDQPDPDTGLAFIDRVSDYQRFLAPPPQTPKSGMTGEALFNQVGCNHCHVSTYVTADDPSITPALRNREIKPYSDFLLHDMGINADFIQQGDAGPTEIRTPPLWGLRLRDPLWHDGRVTGGSFADRMTEVIDLHAGFGSSAAPSANAFFALSQAEQDLVIQFLDSLGRAEFDGVSNPIATNGNTVIDNEDFEFFRGCFEQSGPFTPDDPCAIADFNQDGFVDLEDFDAFLVAYGVQNEIFDCNENGIPDLLEILLDPSLDQTGDYQLDNCDPQVVTCPGDINGDGIVDVTDMGILLNNFGCTGSGCAGDLNGDGVVDVVDLGILLNNFGCESTGKPEPACGDPDTGDCCEPNGTPFCNDAACCEAICAADPFCCETEWDQICATAALAECAVCEIPPPDGCGDPDAGDCCEANGTPFCNDADCCEAVCAADPFCCETEWDQICANQALASCAVCIPDPACGVRGSGDCCEANGTPFCDDADCCEAICAADPFCCETEWDQICADAAIAECDACKGGPAPPSDCCINNGTPGCNDPACEALICAADPFCCDTAWDQLCADAAIAECDACQGGPVPASDCCVANGTPGCDNRDCESLICAADPFCCDTEWDQICANAAFADCAVCQ